MSRITKGKHLLTPPRLARLTRELLEDALDREEKRLGRRLTRQEAEALVLKDFEPVLFHWQPRTIH